MFEAALALPVLLLLVAGALDFGRIFAIYAAMNYAAHLSVSELRTIPQESNSVDGALVQKYLQLGENFLTSTFLTTTPSRARLIPFQQPTSLGGGQHFSAYLRPGESATYVSGGSFAHPVGVGPSATRPWEMVLSQHPVMVRIEAEVGFFLLPLPPRRLAVAAYAYRRTRTREDLAAPAGIPPTATPGSNPPGGGAATPTPTPTPNVPPPTPVPTPTPCPCMATGTCCTVYTAANAVCCQPGG